ncbi:MAG: hypothetical protein DCC55_26015 [Chloroflexi bacterium]|nr:MAG: hypothetical protein DCC55_26015 [Chloroflexota bacterium]
MVKFNAMNRTDRQIAWLLFALALALYLRTLAPGLLDGDPGEFQTAAWRFGLAHPTGYPLYLLAGGVWQRLLALIGVAPATALNVFSALVGAATVTLLFLIMRRWLPGNDTTRRVGALFSAAILAANPTFWSQSLIAEVYTLHALFIILILAAFQSVELGRPGDAAGNAAVPASNLSISQSHPISPAARRSLALLALVVGLSLTHHAMTLLIVPGLLVALTLLARNWWRCWRTVATMALAGLLPLALYLYIPLRSGPDASPWYHQRLNGETLALYQNNWGGFVDFITGRSISVGFYSPAQALANAGLAWTLWRIHFTWVGLVLMAVGLAGLWQRRNWTLLVLTAGTAILQQFFNLFYAIGDILVYYIPLYLMGAVWCGFAVHAIANMLAPAPAQATTKADTRRPPPTAPSLGFWLALACFILPIWLVRDYYPRLDQSTATGARRMWATILAAAPPSDAILVSNDRNEIAPLFYIQWVEGQATGLTGLFPLIKPEAEFADIGATVETALQRGGDRPIYLIKPMPGLEAKFALAPANDPLVRVDGLAAGRPPAKPVDTAYGPLRLLGYDWTEAGNTATITLYWSAVSSPDDDYTTTIQLFDAQGEKIAQDDGPPGGVYYPTSLWKPGEVLVDRHQLALPPGQRATELLVAMYTPADLTQLAPPLVFPLNSE